MPVEDDPETIPDPSRVLRALCDDHFIADAEGQLRVKSSAFTPSSDGSGTSVVVAELMGEDADGVSRTPGRALDTFPAHDLWEISAGGVRAAGGDDPLGLVLDPTEDEPGHANIKWPLELGGSKAHKVRKRLALGVAPVPPEDL